MCAVVDFSARFVQAQEVTNASLQPTQHHQTADELPDAPRPQIEMTELVAAFKQPANADEQQSGSETSSSAQQTDTNQQTDTKKKQPKAKSKETIPVDADGNPIALDLREPTRILGFMPNFRSVSSGAQAHPPGWKYNFTVATHQATDYSSFIFLGITSLSAEWINQHPVLGKGIGGFYAYTWRGFLDKTDNTYLSAWLLSSLLHQDTRYYAMGHGHSVPLRILYVISRQAVTVTYGGHQTPNIAGLGAKVATQYVSRYYYPPSAATFSVLATKFGYSVMRDVIFASVREFYPDIRAHVIVKHREKMARLAAKDATPVKSTTAPVEQKQ
jgi:hypothetical protein